VILRFSRIGRSEGHWFRGDRGVGGEVLDAADVSGVRGSRNMSEIVLAELGDGELAENVVEDRGRVLDPVVARTRPAGSKRVKVKASNYSSSGTPYGGGGL